MAYAEKRGNLWRARWRGPDGKLDQQPGFQTKKAATDYGRDQEAAIRGGTYVDRSAGLVTVSEWANQWFPALDLEPTTLANYRYLTEVFVLPTFGHRTLAEITPQEVATWEMRLAKSGLSARTARDARSTFANILGDAIPRHIQANPAARRRGKGRKGLRRIARIQTRERAWPTPLQALLFAERAAVLSGYATDFVMNLTIAYTGARWGEALGLPPECVRPGKLDLHWKLYELNGRFYRGRPKDGSMRTVDIPTFLDALLADHVKNPARRLTCDCRKRNDPADDSRIDWCDGSSYVFLGPLGGHFRRSNYSERVVRPAADGWYPARKGKHARVRLPVLVDAAALWPGLPLVPWPQAEPDTPFVSPRGRGRPAIHPDAAVASWLPVLPGLVPHGLRHGHKTWMDEGKIARSLSTDRMGHEVPGMEGVYGHISPAMRRELLQLLDALWVESLDQRRKLAPRSAVPLLDRLLTAGPPAG